jgi:hypothetical protein
MIIVRVWNESLGWIHEVQDELFITLDSSRHLDEMEEKYPDAKPSGAVICGDNIYPEKGPNS